MKVSPYVLLGAARRRAIRDVVSRNLEGWAERWLIQPAELSVAEPVPADVDHPQLQHARVKKIAQPGDEVWCVYGIRDEHADELALQFFNHHGPRDPARWRTSLIHGVVALSLQELAATLLDHGPLASIESTVEEDLPADGFAPGRGSYRIDCRLGQARLALWLPGPVLLSMAATGTPAAQGERVALTHPSDAVGRQPLSARVVLGHAELSLGDVMQLAVGDVIRMDKGLQDALSLEIVHSKTRFSGYLGQRGGEWAFQIDDVVG